MAKKGKGKNNKGASNKQFDAERRREKRHNRKESQGSCDPDMKIQLEKIGLALKEVPGDGNCLFRALADQLYGCQEGKRQHVKLRQETVDYMHRNRADFEPFFACDEGMDFDRHLELLAEDGTYAGNDAIVAFSRRYEVVVVIHQLNEALWKIGEESEQKNDAQQTTTNASQGRTRSHLERQAKHWQNREPAKHNKKETKQTKRQLHISYHNGDHYNSVRRIGDVTGANFSTAANKSADVYIDTLLPDPRINGESRLSDGDEGNCSYGDEEEQECSDYENLPKHVSNTKRLNELAEDVRYRTGTSDMVEIHRHLEQNAYNVDLAVDSISTENARQAARKAKSTLWRDGGTGNRIFGDEVAESATDVESTQQLQRYPTATGTKQGRGQKHQGRKKGKRRDGNATHNGDEDDDFERSQPLPAMQTLSI